MAAYHREVSRHAADAVYAAHDLATELAVMARCDHLPAWIVNMTIERIKDRAKRLADDLDGMQAALGVPVIRERAVWPKTSEERV